MSDNKFDEKFVDQAWAEMHELLDKELPVLSGKRRKAFFWWPLAGLGLICIGVLFFNISHQQAIQPELDATPFQKNLSSSENTPIADYDNSAVKTTEKELAAPSNIAISTPNTINKAKSSLSSRSFSATPLATEAKPLISNPNTIPLNKTTISTVKQMAALEQLPALSITELSPLPFTSNTFTPIVPKTRSRKLIIGVEGGVSSFGSKVGINAYGAGLIGEWSKGDSRWYYLLGLGYDVIKPQASANEKILNFNNTALMPSSTIEGEDIGSYITVNSSISELRYAYLKFAAGYRISDKLSTELGFMPSLLQTSTLTETWSHASGEQTASGDLPESTPFVSRITDDPEEVVNYNLSLLAGLRYQLNPTFSVRIQYRYGLLDIFDGQRNDTYLRGVNLSVGYYIR